MANKGQPGARGARRLAMLPEHMRRQQKWRPEGYEEANWRNEAREAEFE